MNDEMSNKYVGKTVGVFTITEVMPYKDNDGHSLYKGICNECGFERIARYQCLKESTKCVHIRVDGKNVLSKTNWNNKRIKSIFNGIKQRCYNKNNKSYKWYGAKGIKVYDNWMNNPSLFEEWALQNGYNDTLTIDRIDENKDYSPDNCRWVENAQNTKYKSTTSLININGECHTGRDWSKILGFGTNTINTYIKKYGINNTIEFINRYMTNPNLKPHNKNQSVYNLYMNRTITE